MSLGWWRTARWLVRCGVLGGWAWAGVAASPVVAADAELRRVPLRDGSTPEIREAYLRGTVPISPPAKAHAADHDLHDIAILVDDGTLLDASRTRSNLIAQRFYASHGDEYDFLNIMVASTTPLDVEPEAGFAFEQNISNDVQGINFAIYNNGGSIVFGLERLKSLLNMNDLGEYSEDPSEELPGFVDIFSGVDVLGQEAMHMVGAFVTANNADILGRANAHWSFYFESYGSVMEGNAWRDNGDGTWTTIAAGAGFSQLDNYLWGFLLPQQVTDPMYALVNPIPNVGDSQLPAIGLTLAATRRNVTIANITAANGVRNPSAATSQKTYRMAWILVVPAEGEVSAHDLEKIDDFRTQWEEEWFPAETGGVGHMVSDLGEAPVTADFEARVVEGPAGLTVEFDNDSFGRASAFEWDFGDGSTSAERHPTHTYTAEGSYNVTLTVHGAGGPVTRERPAYVRVGRVDTYFSDGFETDLGWTEGEGSTAPTGRWVRAEPEPTFIEFDYGGHIGRAVVQPSEDHTPDGTVCLVTGNAPPGTGPGTADVDGGTTMIVSPAIDLSIAANPVLEFWHWYSNNAGAEPGRDPLSVDVSLDDGVTWTTVRTFPSAHHSWRREQVRLREHVVPSAAVRVRFRAADLEGGSLIEAAVDDVAIFDVSTPTPITVADLFAEASPDGVTLRWSLSDQAVRELVAVGVQRASHPDGPWSVVQAASTAPTASMAFTDATVQAGAQYWYRLLLVTRDGVETSRAVAIVFQGPAWRTAILPAIELADGRVQLRYTLAGSGPVRLAIYDAAGRRVRGLDARGGPGQHAVTWDRTGDGGRRVARGVYFLRLTWQHAAVSSRLVLAR